MRCAHFSATMFVEYSVLASLAIKSIVGAVSYGSNSSGSSSTSAATATTFSPFIPAEAAAASRFLFVLSATGLPRAFAFSKDSFNSFCCIGRRLSTIALRLPGNQRLISVAKLVASSRILGLALLKSLPMQAESLGKKGRKDLPPYSLKPLHKHETQRGGILRTRLAHPFTRASMVGSISPAPSISTRISCAIFACRTFKPFVTRDVANPSRPVVSTEGAFWKNARMVLRPVPSAMALESLAILPINGAAEETRTTKQ